MKTKHTDTCTISVPLRLFTRIKNGQLDGFLTSLNCPSRYNRLAFFSTVPVNRWQKNKMTLIAYFYLGQKESLRDVIEIRRIKKKLVGLSSQSLAQSQITKRGKVGESRNFLIITLFERSFCTLLRRDTCTDPDIFPSLVLRLASRISSSYA